MDSGPHRRLDTKGQRPRRREGTRPTGAPPSSTRSSMAPARNLTRAEIAVWLILYRDTREGTARTSYDELARRAGLNRRNVGRAVRRLEQRPGKDRVSGRQGKGSVTLLRPRGVRQRLTWGRGRPHRWGHFQHFTGDARATSPEGDRDAVPPARRGGREQKGFFVTRAESSSRLLLCAVHSEPDSKPSSSSPQH